MILLVFFVFFGGGGLLGDSHGNSLSLLLLYKATGSAPQRTSQPAPGQGNRSCRGVFLSCQCNLWAYICYGLCVCLCVLYRPFEPMEFMGNQYFIAKNAAIKAERRILKVGRHSGFWIVLLCVLMLFLFWFTKRGGLKYVYISRGM